MVKRFGITEKKMRIHTQALQRMKQRAEETAVEYWTRYMKARTEAYRGRTDVFSQQAVDHLVNSLQENYSIRCHDFCFLDPNDTGQIRIGTPLIYVSGFGQLRDHFLMGKFLIEQAALNRSRVDVRNALDRLVDKQCGNTPTMWMVMPPSVAMPPALSMTASALTSVTLLLLA